MFLGLTKLALHLERRVMGAIGPFTSGLGRVAVSLCSMEVKENDKGGCDVRILANTGNIQCCNELCSRKEEVIDTDG